MRERCLHEGGGASVISRGHGCFSVELWRHVASITSSRVVTQSLCPLVDIIVVEVILFDIFFRLEILQGKVVLGVAGGAVVAHGVRVGGHQVGGVYHVEIGPA